MPPPRPVLPIEQADLLPACSASTLCAAIFALIFLLAIFLGWVPLLVTGIVYYTHPISGNICYVTALHNRARSAVGRAQGLVPQGSGFDPDLFHKACYMPFTCR